MLNKSKSMFDLTVDDFNKYQIWYYPMDDSVENETIVAPIEDSKILERDYQIIVKTKFICNNKNEYIGYLYWGKPESIEYIKPTIIINDENIYFWHGIRKPDQTVINTTKKVIGDNAFPIKFKSQEIMGLESIKGNLEGLYYIDDSNNVSVIKM